MSIWKWNPGLEAMQKFAAHSMSAHIGIQLTEIGPDFLRGTMPVDHRTQQPYGRLHGGANVVLAEELGSVAAAMCTNIEECIVVGLDINANHIRGVMGGTVTGTARPLHIGRTTQVWEIRIEDEQGRLACISRLTMSVVPKAAPLK